jgi:hypothetical protein
MRKFHLAVLLALAPSSAFAARASVPVVVCSQQAPEPGGICSPYDRTYCRFADGTLLRDDPRDPRAPYLLKPVAAKADVYCLYDADMHPAGVVTVLTPAEQRRRLDAMKHHPHHQ